MKTKDNKILYILAGISSMILALLLIIQYFETAITKLIFGGNNYMISYYYSFITINLGYLASIVLAFGLIKLSKKYNKKFLKVAAWIFLILSAILLLKDLLIILKIARVYILPIEILLGTHLAGLFFLSAIILGIGILALRENIKLSRYAGIFMIIGAAIRLPLYYISRIIPIETIISSPIYFIAIAAICYICLVLAFILSAVLLFKENKK